MTRKVEVFCAFWTADHPFCQQPIMCITLLAQYRNGLCWRSHRSQFSWKLTRDNRVLVVCNFMYCPLEKVVNVAEHLCFLNGLLHYREVSLGSHISDPAWYSMEPGYGLTDAEVSFFSTLSVFLAYMVGSFFKKLWAGHRCRWQPQLHFLRYCPQIRNSLKHTLSLINWAYLFVEATGWHLTFCII